MIGSFQYFRFSFREVAPTMNEVLKYVQSTGLDKEHPAVVFTENVLKKLDNLQGICGGYVIKNEPVLPTEGVIKLMILPYMSVSKFQNVWKRLHI